MPPAKQNSSTSDSVQSIPAASTELEATASQDASVVALNMSTSVADPAPGSQLKQVCPPSALSEEDARDHVKKTDHARIVHYAHI